MKLISPRFYMFPPRNWRQMMQKGYKTEYINYHPIAYHVISVISIIVLFIPVLPFTYNLLMIARSGIEIFGPFGGIVCIGSMFVGAAFSNIVWAFMRGYLGHVVTLAFGGFGAIILYLVFSSI